MDWIQLRMLPLTLCVLIINQNHGFCFHCWWPGDPTFQSHDEKSTVQETDSLWMKFVRYTRGRLIPYSLGDVFSKQQQWKHDRTWWYKLHCTAGAVMHWWQVTLHWYLKNKCAASKGGSMNTVYSMSLCLRTVSCTLIFFSSATSLTMKTSKPSCVFFHKYY